jgi:hypothetical protein
LRCSLEFFLKPRRNTAQSLRDLTSPVHVRDDVSRTNQEAGSQRLNRQLKKEDKVIRSQGGRGGGSGLHFIVDTKKGGVLLTGLDAAWLVNMARKRGVMAAWEEVQ